MLNTIANSEEIKLKLKKYKSRFGNLRHNFGSSYKLRENEELEWAASVIYNPGLIKIYAYFIIMFILL